MVYVDDESSEYDDCVVVKKGLDIKVLYENVFKMHTLVPIMTSATQPSGKVEASGVNSYEQPYHAFNESKNGWIGKGTSSWIQYTFPTSKNVSRVDFSPFASQYNGTDYGYRCKKFQVLASNDGVSFTQLFSGETANSSNVQTFTFANNINYKTYRININDSGGLVAGLSKLQFYGN